MNEDTDREKHLEWCKARALECVDTGDIRQAWASMVSDLGKHKDTKDHSDIEMGTTLFLSGNLSDAQKMRKFILGIN